MHIYLPALQSLSFQNDESSPFSLHWLHTSRPLLVHHHHLLPFAGFTRSPHRLSAQYLESLPLDWHLSQVLRPSSVQNHHFREYRFTLPDLPCLCAERHLRNFLRSLLVQAKECMSGNAAGRHKPHRI